MWEDLQQEYGGRLDFILVDRDSDEGGAFARAHGIRYQPGFVIYNSAGALVHAELGPYDEYGMRELIRSALEES